MTYSIQGFCDPRFSLLEEAFRANFDEGLELGASLALTWHGKPVVDLWGGWANIRRTRAWRRNTIVLVLSTTKIMLLLCVLRLIDQGRLRLDDTVTSHWPAFGEGGKDKVTVREVITHRGGVPGFVPAVTAADLPDWGKMTSHIAAQPHRFDGKPVACYHLVTYGFVLGELIRRIDGRLPSQYFRDEFMQPTGADFHMGLSSVFQLFRLAEVSPPPPPAQRSALAIELVGSCGLDHPDATRTFRTWRYASATIPGILGFSNARAIARLCSIFAMNGHLDGRQYLSQAIVAQAASEQVYDTDIYIGRIRWGLGFGLDSPDYPAPSPTSFHWGGVGGSWGLMDPVSQVSLGYAPNNFLGGAGAGFDPRLARFNAALRETMRDLPL